MSSSKSDIKSKRQKSHNSKGTKERKYQNIIQIQSSEEEFDVQPIQKRRLKNIQTSQQTIKINSFRTQKFAKVNFPPMRIQSEPQIAIVECTNDQPMKHSEARALMTYKIEGNEGTKYVSDLYLHQRIQKMLTEKEPKATTIEPIQSFKEENKLQEEEPEQQEEKETRERPLRYFDIIDDVEEEKRLIKCFRCGKRGHIAKNCIFEQEKDKCMYCLQDHHHHDCNSRACFRCNELGHVAQECTAVGVECHRCRKRGHSEHNCGTIIFLDYNKFNSDRQFRDRFGAQDLKKLRCLHGCKVPYGHFNCFQYTQKSRPYQRTGKRLILQDNSMSYEERGDSAFRRSNFSRQDQQYMDYYQSGRSRNYNQRFEEDEVTFGNRRQRNDNQKGRKRQNKMF